MTQEIEREALPPLPNPVRWEEAPPGIAANGWPQCVYTADQMRAYARAALSMKAPAEPAKYQPCLNCGCDLTGVVKHYSGCPNDPDAPAQPPVDEREALQWADAALNQVESDSGKPT